MQLAVSDADPALAAAALYYVGLAHERMGRPDVAWRLYGQLADRTDIPDEIRASARDGRHRLTPPTTTQQAAP